MRTLHWFRNDLRLTDNPALAEGLKNADSFIGVYFFESSWFEKGPHGGLRIGPYRAQFIWEAVSKLKESIREIGGHLFVIQGDPKEWIPRLIELYQCHRLSFSKGVGTEEIQLEEGLTRTLPIDIVSRWSHTLIDLENLPFSMDKTPDVFTAFRNKIEKYHTYPTALGPLEQSFSHPVERDELSISGIIDLNLTVPERDHRSAFPFKGGANEAEARLQHYFWDSHQLSKYKETRNGLLGTDYSSKFSPWLALGCISPRRIFQEVQRYENEVEANDSTYWLIFELLWRDFFQLVALKHGSALFAEFGWKGIARKWAKSSVYFDKWKNGETGDPFVDANMKELKQTGFMSNRGRQNVASYLTHQYKIDWRWGASYFEEMLIDYDVASNWGNWSYVSGTGNDPRKDRVFNTKLQAERYDPEGDYVRTWME